MRLVSPSVEEATTSHRFRWVICALLFAATATNYADRQILPLLKPTLDRELHWSAESFGYVNAAFQVSYALGMLAFGWVIDRLGVKVGLALSVLASSLAALGHMVVSSAGGFAFARFALGAGSAGNFPGAVKTVALWFPVRERALAATLFNAGANVGAVVTPMIVPVVLLAYGWRATFAVGAAFGVLWLVLWTVLYREPPRSDERPAEARPPSAQISDDRLRWSALLRRRDTWAFIVPKCLTDPVWGLMMLWLPDFFFRTQHRELQDSWGLLVAIYSLATVVSLLGGWLPEWLIGRGWSVMAARRAALLAAAAGALPLLTAGFVIPWLAVVIIGVAGGAHQAWSANMFTLVSDSFPAQAIARIVGLGGLISALGVSVLSVVSGRVIDHFVLRGEAAAGYHVLFVAFAVSYSVALVVLYLIAPKQRDGATPSAPAAVGIGRDEAGS